MRGVVIDDTTFNQNRAVYKSAVQTPKFKSGQFFSGNKVSMVLGTYSITTCSGAKRPLATLTKHLFCLLPNLAAL